MFGSIASYATEAGEEIPQAGQLVEIVVTAQRRAENLIDVPVAVSVVSAAQIEASHIQTTYDLAALTPGLVSYEGIGFFLPHLRGIGNTTVAAGVESPVATYIDGVFIASLPGALLSLNSIERIEVDKGPQGTLFGRNANGGVVQIVTRDPSQQFGGTASLGYGNYNTVNAQLYVTGGVTSDLAGDFAIYYNDRFTGFGQNLYNGKPIGTQDDVVLRTKWLWTPTERDTARVSLDYSYSLGNAYTNFRTEPGTIPFGSPPFASSNPWDVNSATQPSNSLRSTGITLNYEHTFDFARLVDITGYRATASDTIFAFSLPPFDIGSNNAGRYYQFSEELQLQSPSDSYVKWVAGLYYLNAPAETKPFALLGNFLTVIAGAPSTPITNNTITDQSEAVFGQATLPLPAHNALTVGARYTIEQRSIYGTVGLVGIPETFQGVDAHESFGAESWHISFDHHFTDNLMAYVSASRGFRAGTYDGAGSSVAALEVGVKPETLSAFEIGTKGEFLNRRLRVNAAGFFYNYNDIQVPIYTATGVTVLNGPKAKVYGGELEVDMAATDRLSFQSGISLLHSYFVSFPDAPSFGTLPGGGITTFAASAKGHRLPIAPEETFDIASTYRLPLASGAALSFTTTYYYVAKSFTGVDNELALPVQNLLGATVAWSSQDDRTKVSLWGSNLLNRQMYLAGSEAAPWGNEVTFAPPRTYGMVVRYKF